MVATLAYPKTLTETRARIESAWSDWVRAVESVPATRRLEHGVCGYWSLKDLIAHIALWENYVPEHVQRWLLDLPVIEVDADVLNAEVVRENTNRSYEMVFMDMHRAHQTAMTAIASIERDLDDDIGERISCETWTTTRATPPRSLNGWVVQRKEIPWMRTLLPIDMSSEPTLRWMLPRAFRSTAAANPGSSTSSPSRI